MQVGSRMNLRLHRSRTGAFAHLPKTSPKLAPTPQSSPFRESRYPIPAQTVCRSPCASRACLNSSPEPHDALHHTHSSSSETLRVISCQPANIGREHLAIPIVRIPPCHPSESCTNLETTLSRPIWCPFRVATETGHSCTLTTHLL